MITVCVVFSADIKLFKKAVVESNIYSSTVLRYNFEIPLVNCISIFCNFILDL